MTAALIIIGAVGFLVAGWYGAAWAIVGVVAACIIVPLVLGALGKSIEAAAQPQTWVELAKAIGGVALGFAGMLGFGLMFGLMGMTATWAEPWRTLANLGIALAPVAVILGGAFLLTSKKPRA